MEYNKRLEQKPTVAYQFQTKKINARTALALDTIIRAVAKAQGERIHSVVIEQCPIEQASQIYETKTKYSGKNSCFVETKSTFVQPDYMLVGLMQAYMLEVVQEVKGTIEAVCPMRKSVLTLEGKVIESKRSTGEN